MRHLAGTIQFEDRVPFTPLPLKLVDNGASRRGAPSRLEERDEERRPYFHSL